MKGGVTSGVVYPAAVSRLARTYRFVNVGGASAGAIAAALTAAAEHARAQGDPTGFERLERVSAELAGSAPAAGGDAATGLLALFQPEARTRPLFGVLRAVLDAAGARGPGAAPSSWRRTLRTALRQEVTSAPGWWRTALPVVPGVVVTALALSDLGVVASVLAAALAVVLAAVLALRRRALRAPAAVAAAVAVVALLARSDDVRSVLAGLLGLALVGLGAGAGVAWALAHRALHEVPRNAFGLVGGLGRDGTGGGAAQPALTPWLARRLDEVAGRDPRDGPLTFAHLWGAGTAAEKERLLRERGARRVNLEVMTTDLAQGRPRRLPVLHVGTDAEEHLFFAVEEFRALFPADVVTALVQAAETAPPALLTGVDDVVAVLAAARGLHRLPRADLPVVVAARMSLSFPGLVSAVPLHDLDVASAANTAAAAAWTAWLAQRRAAGLATTAPDVLARAAAPGVPQPELLRTWISDGGITSNMPLHFFDAALPTRPSFAINLQRRQPGEERVTLPRGGDGGGPRVRDRFAQAPVPTLLPFAVAIARTAQNWVDNEQMRMPGYRERIVSVHLDRDEGGLNLAMPGAVIRTLGEAGREAADVLVHRYHDGDAPGWVDQRWIRYRSLAAALERLLATVARTADLDDPATKAPTYEEMARGAWPPDVSPLRPGQQEWVAVRSADLVALARRWPDPVPAPDGPVRGSFTDGEPTPVPQWRAEPEL